ncbi:MAG: MarR family transcriptional regulator [Rhodococcus sp.]|nr:MarR family transcriptional regulator [Rhodococcus sp. (in: high G+C Gram-positive bacteria)]
MWRAYLDSTRLLFRALDRQLVRDSGISLADYELLVILSEAPGRRRRMSEIADAAVTTRSGVTRAVSRLVELGWVVREGCATDRRGTHAELTDEGFRVLQAASYGHIAAVRSLLFDRLADGDIERFTASYTSIRDGMNQQ